MIRTTENNLVTQSRPVRSGRFLVLSGPTDKILTCLVLSIFLSGTLLLGMGTVGIADELTKMGFGTLTSVEADRTVIIDERGYSVDSSAKVTNGDGRWVRMKELTLPAEVKFEYVSGPKGPVIKSLKVMGK